jgi:hypothetical protein
MDSIRFTSAFERGQGRHLEMHIYVSQDVQDLLENTAEHSGQHGTVNDYLRGYFSRHSNGIVIDASYEQTSRKFVLVFRRHIPRFSISSDSFVSGAIRCCGLTVRA